MKKLEEFPKIFEEYPQNDKQFIRKWEYCIKLFEIFF